MSAPTPAEVAAVLDSAEELLDALGEWTDLLQVRMDCYETLKPKRIALRRAIYYARKAADRAEAQS